MFRSWDLLLGQREMAGNLFWPPKIYFHFLSSNRPVQDCFPHHQESLFESGSLRNCDGCKQLYFIRRPRKTCSWESWNWFINRTLKKSAKKIFWSYLNFWWAKVNSTKNTSTKSSRVFLREATQDFWGPTSLNLWMSLQEKGELKCLVTTPLRRWASNWISNFSSFLCQFIV